ncbi:MAG: tail fiber protein [Bacilli bacterium]|nr:tail fiber protein [Bacilli bacterium]
MNIQKNIVTKEVFEAYKKSQQRKNKMYIIIAIICLFLSGISNVFSYNFGASSVGYTPTDANWKVENTQEAIDDLFDSVGSALVGAVYSYMGLSAPYGYLICDGTVYNINDYPRLADHIYRNFGKYNFFGGDGETTFAVPDLKGEFLRGSGTNSHTYGGIGASVGVHQAPTRTPYIISGSNRLSVLSTAYIENADTTQGNSKLGYTNASSSTTNSYPNFFTSRPTNTSVLFIIKY